MSKLDFENVKKLVAFKKAVFWEREVRVLLMLQASTIAASQQAHLLGFALRRRLLLGQQNCLDVGQHTTLSNGHSLEQLVQLFVVSDGQLQVSGNDSPFVIVSGSVSCQLQDFSSQVLQHSCKVDWGTSSNSLSVVSLRMHRWIRPTGNCRPARLDRVFEALAPTLPLFDFPPLPDIVFLFGRLCR